MYVCICKAVKEEDLKNHIASGADSVDAVQKVCGAASACGSCRIKLEGYLTHAKKSDSDTMNGITDPVRQD